MPRTQVRPCMVCGRKPCGCSTAYGTVVEFPEGTTYEEAQALVERIRELGALALDAQSYKPDWGGPVWYIP